jgi:hypothetical protein
MVLVAHLARSGDTVGKRMQHPAPNTGSRERRDSPGNARSQPDTDAHTGNFVD